jgi:hypothetical protein
VSFEQFLIQWVLEQLLFTMGSIGVLILVCLAFTAVMHYAPPWGGDQ